MSTTRSRWAALGAAVAVTIGAGGAGIVGATKSTGERASYEAVTACRVLDTRSDQAIGSHTTPLGAGETIVVDALPDGGDCTGLPDGTAVALNVTAVGATKRTHLTIWDAGPVPNASSLNPAPGQPPAPNAVTTRVDADGSFRIYNFAGEVDLIVDLVGVFSDHDHGESKFLTFQPTTLPLFDGATVASGPIGRTGVVLDDGLTPGFDVSFTLPTDYSANSSMFLEVLWHIDETTCAVEWQTEYGHMYRHGDDPASAGFAMVATDSVPSTAGQAARTKFQIQPNGGLAAGDALALGLSRNAPGPGDTCTGDVIVTGVSVSYS